MRRMLLCSLAGLFVLLTSLHAAGQCVAPDEVTAVNNCTTCADCYTCLQTHHNQDLSECLYADTSTVLYCAAQILFLYPNPRWNYPCRQVCVACHADLVALQSTNQIQPPVLSKSPWVTLYGGLFSSPRWRAGRAINEEEAATGDITDDEESMVDIDNDEGLEHVLARYKRDDDYDSCCQTQRQMVPRLSTYTLAGVLYRPVWLRVGALLAYQYYDVITCPSLDANCGGLQCVLHVEPRTFLMSTLVPDPYYGFTFVVLSPQTYTQTRFITIDVGAYCKCIA